MLLTNSTRDTVVLAAEIKKVITDLVTDKLLRVHSSVMSKNDMRGKFMNVITADLINFDGILAIIRFHSVFATVIACFIVVPIYFGLWGIIGLAISVLHIPVILYALQLTQEYRTRKNRLSDKRIKLTQNLIEGIKIVKLYGWEAPYLQLIFENREEEKQQEQSILNIVSIVTVMCFAGLSLVLLASMSLYAILGNEMESSEVFFLVSVYIFTQSYAIYAVIGGIKAYYSIKLTCQRIQEIFLLKEYKRIAHEASNPTIVLENCEFSWEDLEENGNQEVASMISPISFRLSNLTFSVTSNELLLIVGPSGSGKTTLLMGLLGEIEHKANKFSISGSVGYAAEDPWIISGTLKENILMGREYNESLYYQVIKNCALEPDISSLPNGDNSLVGDRGITLSGGQKSRLGLARVLYSNSDIYLLDDPLSSVDTEVGMHLFNTIKELSSTKIVVLVTHHIHFVNHADKVLVLNDGTQVFYGTPQELQKFKSEGTNLENFILGLSTIKAISSDSPEENPQIKMVPEDQTINDCEVTYKTYWKYTKFGHSSILLLVVVVILLVIGQGSVYVVQYWCALWINSGTSDTSYYIQGMVVLVVLSYILYTLRIFAFNKLLIDSNINLHNKALEGLTKTDSGYFDVNSSGILITRFTKDAAYLDEAMIRVYYDSTSGFVTIICAAVVLIIIMPYNAFIIPIWVLLFYYVLKNFNPVIVQMKTNELVVKGGLLSVYNSLLSGYITIRSQLLSQHFIDIANERSLSCYRAAYMFELSVNFVCFFLVMVVSIMLVINVVVIIGTKDVLDPTIAAFSLTLSTVYLKLTRGLGISMVSLHSCMCSAQRLLYFSELKPEGEYVLQPDFKITKGSICFSNISMRYRPECNLALNNLSFNIQGGSKVGIVGRTGAGKSSILQVLFRLVNQESGSVFIDGVDHMTLGLHDLRKELSVIPQSPFLFSGSIRNNLDPFKKYSDKEILDTLDQVSLNLRIEDPTDLDSLVVGKDLSFSLGQKQLLCLARAILRKNQIVMMDEATSNIDNTTDQIVQEIVRESFRECTLLIIAHRLRTVIKTDQIIVMDNGSCRETGTPLELFNEEQSIFRSLVLGTTSDESEFLVRELNS